MASKQHLLLIQGLDLNFKTTFTGQDTATSAIDIYIQGYRKPIVKLRMEHTEAAGNVLWPQKGQRGINYQRILVQPTLACTPI